MRKLLIVLASLAVIVGVAWALWPVDDSRLEEAIASRDSALVLQKADSTALVVLRAVIADTVALLQAQGDSARQRAAESLAVARSRGRVLVERLPPEEAAQAQAVIDGFETTIFELEGRYALLEAELAAERRLSAAKDGTIALERAARAAEARVGQILEQKLRPNIFRELMIGVPAVGIGVATGIIFGEDTTEKVLISAGNVTGYLLSRSLARK